MYGGVKEWLQSETASEQPIISDTTILEISKLIFLLIPYYKYNTKFHKKLHVLFERCQQIEKTLFIRIKFKCTHTHTHTHKTYYYIKLFQVVMRMTHGELVLF